MEVDINTLWSLADEARAEWCLETGNDAESAEDDEGVCRDFERQASRARSMVFRLPDGDVHVCGVGCDRIGISDDGCYVCDVSGVEYGPVATRTDQSTGRSVWSSDPDVNSAPGQFSWRRRPDQAAASAHAFTAAQWMDDKEMPATLEAARVAPAKRGAICVDQARTIHWNFA